MRATVLGDHAGRDGLARRLRPLLERLGRELDRDRCTLSVLLTDDAGIRDYNRRFRGLDEPTDVLSFAAEAGDVGADGHYLGDLVVSLDRAAEQAADLGHALADEVEVLVLHGVLHLLGHDHEVDDGGMRALEARLARTLFGGARGLTERAEDAASAGD
jgi:probable rRNA maturation factor